MPIKHEAFKQNVITKSRKTCLDTTQVQGIKFWKGGDFPHLTVTFGLRQASEITSEILSFMTVIVNS